MLKEDPKSFLRKYLIDCQRELSQLKQVTRTQEKQFQEQEAKLFLELLEISDAFENIFAHIKEKEALLATGSVESTSIFTSKGFKKVLGSFEAIHRKYCRFLERKGVTPISFEDGMARMGQCKILKTVETADHPPGYILQTVKKGYLMKDQVLRPVEVITAS